MDGKILHMRYWINKYTAKKKLTEKKLIGSIFFIVILVFRTVMDII